ncbi:hypothetical protein ACFT5C_32700 [Streptomyces sp. NPDC057116]|uniref:hypothetical protein n=1 Tax=Streptomyces sp. NPDC057116 TaxID=3346023 RepID=UPI0036435330
MAEGQMAGIAERLHDGLVPARCRATTAEDGSEVGRLLRAGADGEEAALVHHGHHRGDFGGRRATSAIAAIAAM